MWKVVVKVRRSLAVSGHPFLKAVREWSRPVRVAGHAIADLRKTKGELGSQYGAHLSVSISLRAAQSSPFRLVQIHC